MKSSPPQTGTRRSEGYDEFVVRLPDPKLLRVVARLMLLATAAIVSSPWLCNVFQPDPPDAAVRSKLADDPFSPPTTIEKIMPHADEGEFKVARRLLSVLGSRKEALGGLEDAFLEQPEAEKKIRKINYLPDLMGDNWLVGHPRRVFVDVDGAKKRGRNTDWFEREYPKKGAEFEIVKVELAEREGGGGIGDWLEKNVRAEEFVVMKADADAVEEMVRENVIDLVDELFLACDATPGKRKRKRKSRRAYWECLALYGRVRDEGVAVHQWWE